MRLHPAMKDCRVRRPWWGPGMFYLIKQVGKTQIVAIDEAGQELVFNRNDDDRDWDVMKEGKREERDLLEGRN